MKICTRGTSLLDIKARRPILMWPFLRKTQRREEPRYCRMKMTRLGWAGRGGIFSIGDRLQNLPTHPCPDRHSDRVSTPDPSIALVTRTVGHLFSQLAVVILQTYNASSDNLIRLVERRAKDALYHVDEPNRFVRHRRTKRFSSSSRIVAAGRIPSPPPPRSNWG